MIREPKVGESRVFSSTKSYRHFQTSFTVPLQVHHATVAVVSDEDTQIIFADDILLVGYRAEHCCVGILRITRTLQIY